LSRKTITDVAKAAGVAIKTVSRVLNNEPRVRPATRERVMAAVKALNYFPSISARGLAGRRSCLVGLVYENPSPNYIMDVQNGAMARCREERFQLIMHHYSGRGADLATDIGRLVDQTHLDGLVLTPPLSSSKELIQALDARTGTLLWKQNLGAAINSGPMSYRIGNRQYIATVSGLSLFVFALDE